MNESSGRPNPPNDDSVSPRPPDTLIEPETRGPATPPPPADPGVARDRPRELRQASRTRYRFDGEHARGGLGRILAAYDMALGRHVAVKELLRAEAHSEARFVREAFVTARLEHPSIVPVYDAGRWRDSGKPFYEMKMVRGRPMSELLDEATTLEQRLGLLPNMLAMIDAIAYAHSEGVIHRDLKPANVVIGRFGETVVIDWGLAKDLASAESDRYAVDEYRLATAADLTVAGQVVGTPAYMPPEQARGEDTDERADIYALGAILYHLVAGAPPYEGASTQDVIEQVRRGPPTPLDARIESAPRELCAIVDHAIARAPEHRYANAVDLARELRQFQQGGVVKAYRYRWRDKARRWLRRRRGALAAAGLVGLAAALAVTLSVTPRVEADLPCKVDPDEFAGVWDPNVRAAMATAFRAASPARADATVAAVSHALDAYVAQWHAMRTSSCAATHVEGSQSDAVFEARRACLERRKTELGALTTVLGEKPDLEVLDNATAAAASLVPIAHCADVDALMARLPPPETEAERAKLRELESSLGRVSALEDANKRAEALALVDSVVAEAETLGYLPIRARAAYEQGSLLAQTGAVDKAEATLRDAMQLASEARDDQLVAQVWIELMRTIGYHARRVDDARTFEPWARAAVARAGSPPCVEASLLITSGSITRDYDVLVRTRKAAVDLLAAAGEADGYCHARASLLLAAMLYDRGDYDDAIAHYRSALAFWEAHTGGNDLMIAALLNNIGLALKRQRKLDEALDHHTRALAVVEAAAGPDHLEAGGSHNHLGNVMLSLERYDEAEAHYRRSLEIREQVYGPEHSRVASTLMNLGTVAQARGDYAGALAHYRTSLELKERALGEHALPVATSLINIGHALTALGKYPEAVAALERAVDVTRRNKVQPIWLAEAHFALAKALWQTPAQTRAVRQRNRARAVSLARDAETRFAGLGEPGETERAEVEAWLSEVTAPAGKR